MDFNALMAKKLGGKFSVPEKEMTVNGKVTNWMERWDKKKENVKKPTTYAGKQLEAAKGKRNREVIESEPVLESGVITSNAGFMMLPQTEEIVESVTTKDADTDKTPERKKKKSPKEFLMSEIKVKTEQRKKKTNLNSFKNKYLTLKKKAASHQIEHGTQPDYMLIVKNNLQDPHVTNPSPTAGKYMVIAEGPIKEQLLGKGVKFVQNDFFMMTNSWDMSQETIEHICFFT